MKKNFKSRERTLTLTAAVLFLLFAVFLTSCQTNISSDDRAPSTDMFRELGIELTPPSLEEANAVMFLNLDKGVLLASKNEDKPIAPASTAKIAAGLLFCEAFSDKESQDRSITLTASQLDQCSSNKLNLTAGDRVTPYQLMCAALCGGYNDATELLAVLIAGNVSDFVADMNSRVAKLGATHTIYKNPTGLDADGAVTTASDVVLIAAEAYRNSLYMEITSKQSYTIIFAGTGREEKIYTKNLLLSDYTTTIYYNPLCAGLNAGQTDAGGCCVVTSATAQKARYLCVVMGAKSNGQGIFSYIIANRLVKWAKETFYLTTLMEQGSDIQTLDVSGSGGFGDQVVLQTAEDLTAFLPNTIRRDDLTVRTHFTKKTVKAPFSAGDDAGYLAAEYGGKTVASVRLVTASGAEAGGIYLVLNAISAYAHSRALMASLVFAALATPIALIWRRKRRVRRRRLKK